MNTVNTTSTIIGMQPHHFPGEIEDDYVKQLLYMVEGEIRKDIFSGYHIFQTGMNMGVDIWCAEMILALRNEFPHIQLHCFLPCETQANHWPEPWRERYFNILAEADGVFCISQQFSRGCTHVRNKEMLALSSKLIAVHKNIADGGIARAISYAKEKNIDTVVLHPGDEGDAAPGGSGNVVPFNGYISSQTSSEYLAGSFSGISAIRRA